MFLSTLLLFTCIFICMYVLYVFTKGTFTNSKAGNCLET